MLQEAKITDPWANTWLDDLTGWQAAAELTVDHVISSDGSVVGNLQLLSGRHPQYHEVGLHSK